MSPEERKQTADFLRAMACAAGEPWTGDTPHEDHGHTTCWHLHRAADWLDPRMTQLTAGPPYTVTMVNRRGDTVTLPGVMSFEVIEA